MNLDTLSVDLQYLAGSGRTFNIEERAAIQSALHMLKAEQGFSRVQLWGKILGQKTDYIIAQGYYQGGERVLSKDGKPIVVPYFDSYIQMPKKSFRLSADGVSWLPLLPAEESLMKRAAEWEEYSRQQGQSFSPFTGLPGTKLPYKLYFELPPPPPAEAPAAPAEGEEPPAEEGEGEGVPKDTGPKFREEDKVINEEERLSALIETIDRDCAVVPRGAYVMNASHQVVANTSFRGLAPGDATRLASYFHLRPIDKMRKKSKFAISELDKTHEFLDPLCEDYPAGVWSLITEPLTSQVLLRSLLWVGYVSYHVTDTNHYGGMYIGHGNKNYDLAFML